ncbi:uncharacterized protein K441DRAFT_677107 [Cenococcum geophilum 1.58]|uniref:uncharacterized protein n=1 Tax=Cenococcum geophilum 1.58 TaxID=794803 RepID=UPI00358E5040|nr:hypothetical protein K441DRAFT_677107 [Cenococcum geophilum 1.58]
MGQMYPGSNRKSPMSPSHEQFNAQLAHALSRRKQFVVVLSGASGAQWVGTRREMETWALGSPTKRWDLPTKRSWHSWSQKEVCATSLKLPSGEYREARGVLALQSEWMGCKRSNTTTMAMGCDEMAGPSIITSLQCGAESALLPATSDRRAIRSPNINPRLRPSQIRGASDFAIQG